MTDVAQDQDEPTPDELLASIRYAAGDPLETTGTPEPIIAGTFVVYPMANGDVMAVFDLTVARLPGMTTGEHRRHVPAGMLRTMSAFAGGAGKLGGVLGSLGRRRARDK